MDNLKNILNSDSKFTLEDLQKLQEAYDNQFVAQKGFSGFSKIRHTYAHMGKLMGRLASFVHDMEENGDASDEDIKSKVIPDLLVYSAWLANEFGVNMEEAYLTRFIGNIKRLYADKVSPEEIQELEDCVKKKLSYK